MSSEAVTEKPDDLHNAGSRRGMSERAPSVMRDDASMFARWVGFCGLMSLTFGSVALAVAATGQSSRVSPTFGFILFLLGLVCLLFHAMRDGDMQIRRIYGVLGYLWLLSGLVVSVLKIKDAPAGAQFLPFGFIGILLGLFFLLPFLKHETEISWRKPGLIILALVGIMLGLGGLIGSCLSMEFFLPKGLLLSLLGLAYLWAFLALQGTATKIGYRMGIAVGCIGILVILVAVGHSVLPGLFYSWHWSKSVPDRYFAKAGFMLLTVGLLYAGLAAGLCSEMRIAVMIARELASFFYSPIAYIVLVGFTVLGWFQYFQFLEIAVRAPLSQQGPMVEPIVMYFILKWETVISMIFVVPALTMRLLSEERRTGSLEVMLTAPINETSVVLSKFFAAIIFYLLLWVPWSLFFVGLRVQGGEQFDYYPFQSFFIALAASGAGFLSMGLFFSSLTKNQIIAAMLTFAAMLPLTFIFFINQSLPSDSIWHALIKYVSYVELWLDACRGSLSAKHLMFHCSTAVFWLFLTVKVLESRKWR